MQHRYELTTKNLPCKRETLYRTYLVDRCHELELVEEKQIDTTDAIKLVESAPSPSVWLAGGIFLGPRK